MDNLNNPHANRFVKLNLIPQNSIAVTRNKKIFRRNPRIELFNHHSKNKSRIYQTLANAEKFNKYAVLKNIGTWKAYVDKKVSQIDNEAQNKNEKLTELLQSVHSSDLPEEYASYFASAIGNAFK
jgi:hypothetical protein